MDKVEQLIFKYVPLARSLAKRYPSLPYDDRVQEALLGLTIAANTFDPEKGAFGPYASVVIRNRLSQMLGTQIKERDDNPTQPFSAFGQPDKLQYNTDNTFEASIPDPSGDQFECLDTALTINGLMKQMPALNRTVLALHLAGQKQSDMAHTLESSQPTISRVLHYVKEAIADAVV